MIQVVRIVIYKRKARTNKTEKVMDQTAIYENGSEAAQQKFDEMVTTANEAHILDPKKLAYVDFFVPMRHANGTLEMNIPTMGNVINQHVVGEATDEN